MSANEEQWRALLTESERAWLAVLWGKSGYDRWTKTRTEPTLLIQHLLDTLAVGGLLWDEFLAPVVRDEIESIASTDGRRFFSWLCGIHDLGKASPAFQSQDISLANRVIQAGLRITTPKGSAQQWRHERASGLILFEHLGDTWVRDDSIAWVWPLAAGHHGQFPSTATIARFTRANKARKRRQFHGSEQEWGKVQVALLQAVAAAAGYLSLAEVEPSKDPSRATQLALSGYIVMADWIASNDKVLDPAPNWSDAGMELARLRARTAVDAARLGHGLGRRAVPALSETASHIGHDPRPLQTSMYEVAEQVTAPGLIICEAPTGEGKTEAALIAAEVLAARFGADGVFVALPTQATANAMLERIVPWLNHLDGELEFALVHGGRATCDAWQQYRHASHAAPKPAGELRLDEYGCPDDFDMLATTNYSGIGTDCPDEGGLTAVAASDWFDGRKRGLLAHNAVGTIDQLLFAGTRTKHVMLRFAGLAGKVVVIDEVHAVDTYMAAFLSQVLAWLGLGRVPVVLLSATLAPRQRAELVESYLRGALNNPEYEADWARRPSGKSLTTAVWTYGDSAQSLTATSETWRPGQVVEVERIDERDEGAELVAVTELLSESLVNGGCALVIRNTVTRACETYDAVVDRFGAEKVRLLHGRLAAGHRAALTSELVERLGPDGQRPERLIIVATQVAEQSFDVDVDLLVTDHAPVDLLIQRAGRMHRHPRPASDRPARLASPRMVLTGIDLSKREPWFAPGSEAVYGRHLLLRTAGALLAAADSHGLVLPDDAPRLVAAVYDDGDIVPDGWRQMADDAQRAFAEATSTSAATAQQYVLVGRGSWTHRTLEGLHDYPAGTEEVVRVRDGDMGTEIVIVTRNDEGYRTIDGEYLGVNGERATAAFESDTNKAAARAVLAGSVRLPGAASGLGGRLNIAAEALDTLSEWADHPSLGRIHVLVLDDALRGNLSDIPIRYDPVRGLLVGTAA